MAKKKVAINIKLDMFAEMNQKDVDRILKMPFRLKKKEFEFEFTKTVEVVDPDWTPKIFQQNLYYSVRRDLQVLAVRAFEALKAYDKEKDMNKQMGLKMKLEKKLNKSAKSIRGRANSNLKQIIDAATKDAPKWDKGREAKDFVEDIEEERDDFEKSLDKLITGFTNAVDDIRNTNGDLWNNHKTIMELEQKGADAAKDKKGPDAAKDKKADPAVGDKKLHKKVMAIQKQKRGEIKSRLTEMGGTFNNFRSSQGKYLNLLKSSKKKLSRLVDSKTKGDSKEMKKLHENFKAIGEAAGACMSDLNTKSEAIMTKLNPLLKFNIENPKNFDETTGKVSVSKNIHKILDVAYSAYNYKDKKLFSLIDQTKKDMKKIKAASK